jgi:hypothetical protein
MVVKLMASCAAVTPKGDRIRTESTPSRSHDCRNRLSDFSAALPEASQRPGGEGARHTAFMVRTKTFAYFTEDHHGDGRLGFIFRAPLGEQAALLASDPDRFFIPPYLGHRGWVGFWLDLPTVDWAEVREFMIEAYRMTAPKRLSALLD